jgi:hypothetical protein
MSKLLLTLLLCATLLSPASAFAPGVETVALFNPAAFETPESVQFDRHGNAYISMAMTSEVRKIAPKFDPSRRQITRYILRRLEFWPMPPMTAPPPSTYSPDKGKPLHTKRRK